MLIKEKQTQIEKLKVSELFWIIVENGIYKELHKRKLLTDIELGRLLQKNSK